MKITRYLSFLPKPVKRFLKDTYASFSIWYETMGAPAISSNCGFLLKPFYQVCKKRNFCFLTNISLGVGHIACETDYFFRQKNNGAIDHDKKYILILKNHPLSKDYGKLFSHLFYLYRANTLLYWLLLPLTMRYEDIRLDCGLSKVKWNFVDLEKLNSFSQSANWPKCISKIANMAAWQSVEQHWSTTPHYFPLLETSSANCQFINYFGLDRKKTAVLQLKSACVNACAKKTDSRTLFPTIEYLLDCGYQVVLGGREKMPQTMKKYPIINYSESMFATFENDCHLFKLASLSIGTSGLQFLAACFNVKILYVNSWHIFWEPPGEQSVCVPTLLFDKNDRPLSAKAQWDLYMSDPQHDEYFPEDGFTARNATEDEILHGCIELLNGNKSSICGVFASPSAPAKSHISAYFIEKHKELFLPRAFKLNQRSKTKNKSFQQ